MLGIARLGLLCASAKSKGKRGDAGGGAKQEA